MKRTALYEEHVKSGGKLVEFAGYELPIQYIGIAEEHHAVRNDVGMFDVSHMGEIEVKGKDALKFVQHLVTNDVMSLVNHQVLYTMMLYEKGTVVDDLLVYRFDENDIYLVVNAANVDKDYAWIQKQAEEFDVNLNNVSDNVVQIALQGPNAQKVLQQLVDIDLSTIEFFHSNSDLYIKDVPALISRTGYTGEDGFEIYVDKKHGPTVWSYLIDLDVQPIGLGARDTLRFEACLPLYGHEISDTITPLEARLGMFVKLDTDFIGKSVLEEQKLNGVERKLVGIELSKGIARNGSELYHGDEKIGFVTTGYKSPTLNKSIALAIVDSAYSKLGTDIDVQVRKKRLSAKVVSRRFYKKNYKK